MGKNQFSKTLVLFSLFLTLSPPAWSDEKDPIPFVPSPMTVVEVPPSAGEPGELTRSHVIYLWKIER